MFDYGLGDIPVFFCGILTGRLVPCSQFPGYVVDFLSFLGQRWPQKDFRKKDKLFEFNTCRLPPTFALTLSVT